MAITTILWDLDGTLVRSESIQDEAIVYASNQLGLSITVADLPQVAGMDNTVLFKYLFAKDHTNNDEYKRWFSLALQYVQTNLPKVVAIHQSIELVYIFAKMGLTQSIVSNSNSSVINDCVDKLNIRQYMTFLIGRDCVSHGKPEPDLYLEGMWRNNAKAHECLVFEDSITGIYAASNANIKNIVAIGDNHKNHLHLVKLNCQLTDNSWRETVLAEFFKIN